VGWRLGRGKFFLKKSQGGKMVFPSKSQSVARKTEGKETGSDEYVSRDH